MQRKLSKSGRGRGSIPHPPQFTPSFVLKKRLRFSAVAASTTTLTPQNLGDLWCVAATTTSAYQIAQSVRLKKIEIWGPMASDLVPVTVSVDWTGSTVPGLFGKSNRVSDTSMGSTEPSYITTKPPAGSQIAQWLSASDTQNLCKLTYPLGAIIDIHYEFVARDDGAAVAVSGAVAGATVGVNYVRSLDSVTATNLVPLSYPTI